MRQLKINKTITNRESESLERYLQEISKVDLLTADEEVALAKRIKEGDTDALDVLIKSNLRFVVSVAKQYQNQGLSLTDLINEGNIGLIKSTEKFDESKGFKFISYAVWWIRQSIMQAIAENSRIVRLPLNKINELGKVNKAFAHLEQEFEREPTVEELSHVLDSELKEVRDLMSLHGKHISLDAPLSATEASTYIDVLVNENAERADDEVTYHESLKIEIERSLQFLSERQSDILRKCFGIGTCTEMSLEDIGREYGLTRERVRQIKDKALYRLKNASKQTLLKEYLP
ncbi:MAG: RNA polymerase sigma factor RpoD/SigA [Chitinophagales bacterium]|nr:RNA polymerase sigma factor RpoD/SigA [Chitinophagales bacterium]